MQYEVLILVLVIEKEFGLNGECEEILVVFYNWLKKYIFLQSDFIVIYGLLSFDGNIYKKDLLSFSLYNIYCIVGLFFGFIVNFGI